MKNRKTLPEMRLQFQRVNLISIECGLIKEMDVLWRIMAFSVSLFIQKELSSHEILVHIIE